MTVACLYLSTLLSVAIVAWGYFTHGMTYPAIILIVGGITWVVGQMKWTWIGSIGFAMVTITAVIGIFLDFPVMPIIAGIMFAFIAWDLAEFNSRLKQAAKHDDKKSIERRHFIRLGLILAAGWGVVLLTRTIRVRFNFEVAALLVLAGVWGISLLVGRLRRNE
jgi:hypothetical protein